MDCQAIRYHGPNDLRLEMVELADPEPGEVLLRVRAAGVCGSDFHFVDGTAQPGRAPVTLGHEVAGQVVNSRHPKWKPGQEVIVEAGVTCGHCRACLEDRMMLCERLRMVGIDLDGGLAEFMVIPGSALQVKPARLDWSIAATAADAAATACHAASCRGKIGPGSVVAVYGVGGLGGYGAQIAKLLGAAPVIAIDRSQPALEAAATLGADLIIDASEEGSVGRQVKLATEGGVDVAAEFVGAPETVDVAVKCLRRGGVAVATGIGDRPLHTLPPTLWAMSEYELRGSFGSLPGDTEQVLSWLADGTLSPPPLLPISMDEAPGVIVAASSNPRRERLVVVPS